MTAAKLLPMVQAPGAIDPVCGMTVDPATAKFSTQHEGRTYYFCCGGCLAKFQADPEKYLDPVRRGGPSGPPAGAPKAGGPKGPPLRTAGRGIHVPDAPRGAADRAGDVPDLRHGARAGGDDGGGAREPRARGHDPALLGERRADRARVLLAMGEMLPGDLAHAVSGIARVDPAGAGHAGRAVGRLAVLRARLAVARQPQPEHVHADRARRRRGLRLQRGRDARARHSSRRRSACTTAAWASTSRRPR